MFNVSSNPSLRKLLAFGSSRRGVVAFALLLPLPGLMLAQGTEPDRLAKLDYSGDQQPIQAIDRQIAAAGRDPGRLEAIATRLLGELRRPGLTFAARQAISQRLGNILGLAPESLPNAAALAPLRKMLRTESEVDVARLALEPVPGAGIDRLFTDALGTSEGHVTLALLQSVGARRISAAVSQVKARLADPDASIATAAARALGAIGTPEALAALQAAPHPSAPAVVAAMLAIASRLPPAEAAALADLLQKDPRIPAAQRSAALHTALAANPAGAAARVVDVLSANDWPAKEAALEWIATSPAAGLVAALTAKLPTWDAPTQAAVTAALGRKGDPAATGAILAELKQAAPAVRAAAVGALGLLPGTPAGVHALGTVIADDDAELARLARQSLARLNGPGVDAALVDGAQHAPPRVRAALLEQIALRNMTDALPLLRAARQSAEPEVRTAAVGALGEIAPAGDQAILIDWALHATDAAEQSRALRSLVAVIQRQPDAANRSAAVIQALEQAPGDVAARSVPVLARLGDRASAEAAARLAVRADPAVANAATATLARWNADTALPSLATVAEQAPSDANRKAALQAAARFLERRRSPWSDDAAQVAVRLYRAAADDKSRIELLRLLGRTRNDAALKLAESLSTDPTLGSAAQDVVLRIRAHQAGPVTFRASGNTGQLKSLCDGKTSTRWSVPADADQWLEIDLKGTRPISKLTLDQSGRAGDYPEHYEVHVTDNPRQPGPVRASGAGHPGQTIIQLPPATRGRYVIIKNTVERPEGTWTIGELQID